MSVYDMNETKEELASGFHGPVFYRAIMIEGEIFTFVEGQGDSWSSDPAWRIYQAESGAAASYKWIECEGSDGYMMVAAGSWRFHDSIEEARQDVEARGPSWDFD